MTSQQQSFYSFGLIADTQYVDEVDGSNFDGSRVRRYRQSLRTLGTACTHFKETNQAFCVILGDVLDMKAAKSSEFGLKCLRDVTDITEPSGLDWHFIVGNHDLLVLPREQIFETYIPASIDKHAICSPAKLYYDFIVPAAPDARVRFVVLDAFERSWLGPADASQKPEAVSWLQNLNHNLKYEPEADSWSQLDWLTGLDGAAKRAVPCGGGVGEEQLSWLRGVLTASKERGERVVIFSHLPVHAGCTGYSECLMWNYDEVQAIIYDPAMKGVVTAVIAGHDHTGGYHRDEFDIHHIIPAAPIDCAEDVVSYGSIEVRSDGLAVTWTGKLPPAEWFPVWPTFLEYPASH